MTGTYSYSALETNYWLPVLPVGAPADVTLAQVLIIRRLLDEQVHLLGHADDRLDMREVSSSQLVSYSVEDRERSLVEVSLWRNFERFVVQVVAGSAGECVG